MVGSPTLIDATHATAKFSFHNNTAQSNTVILGDITANVPNVAAGSYKAKELLSLSAVTVNGATFSGVVAGGVHVNAYLGDVTGNGTIDALDVATANNVAQGISTGFPAFGLLDPAIVGDPQGDMSVDAGDVSALAALVSQLPTPTIPAIPTGLNIVPLGPDPILSLTGGRPAADGTVCVPVMLDDPHPEGSVGMTEAIMALTYDPMVLRVSTSDIALGSIPSGGGDWQLRSVVNQTTGQIGIELFSTTPIRAAQAGSLVSITFHVLPDTFAPTTPVQLVNAAVVSGQQFRTQVDDPQGQFVLGPGVSSLPVYLSEGIGHSRSLIVAHGQPAFVDVAKIVSLATAERISVGTDPLLPGVRSPLSVAAEDFLALSRWLDGARSQDDSWDSAILATDWLGNYTSLPSPAIGEHRTGTPPYVPLAHHFGLKDRNTALDTVFAQLAVDVGVPGSAKLLGTSTQWFFHGIERQR
jgi:hypothetical protein